MGKLKSAKWPTCKKVMLFGLTTSNTPMLFIEPIMISFMRLMVSVRMGNAHLSNGVMIGDVIECAKHNGRIQL